MELDLGQLLAILPYIIWHLHQTSFTFWLVRAKLDWPRQEDYYLRTSRLVTFTFSCIIHSSVLVLLSLLLSKVFEVNCSSQRNGRHVLTQLKEATQSHLVETSGKDLLKPAYLNNYNTNSCSTKPDTLPGTASLVLEGCNLIINIIIHILLHISNDKPDKDCAPEHRIYTVFIYFKFNVQGKALCERQLHWLNINRKELYSFDFSFYRKNYFSQKGCFYFREET